MMKSIGIDKNALEALIKAHSKKVCRKEITRCYKRKVSWKADKEETVGYKRRKEK